MKSTKITYWITTILLFLMEGLMPALTSQSEMAKESIAHLVIRHILASRSLVLKYSVPLP